MHGSPWDECARWNRDGGHFEGDMHPTSPDVLLELGKSDE